MVAHRVSKKSKFKAYVPTFIASQKFLSNKNFKYFLLQINVKYRVLRSNKRLFCIMQQKIFIPKSQYFENLAKFCKIFEMLQNLPNVILKILQVLQLIFWERRDRYMKFMSRISIISEILTVNATFLLWFCTILYAYL